MRRNGFTIIELMVVLAVISLTAYLSLPRVEEWAARQQARQFASRLIADISKATMIARTTQNLSGLPSGAGITKAAILFAGGGDYQKKYYLLARPGTTSSNVNWSPASDVVIRTGTVPSRISIYTGPWTTQGHAYVFSPSGEMREGSTGMPKTTLTSWQCNSLVSSTTVMSVIFKTNLHTPGAAPIWYWLAIDPYGGHRLCQKPESGSWTSYSAIEVKGL